MLGIKQRGGITITMAPTPLLPKYICVIQDYKNIEQIIQEKSRNL
jgi:hypothetical protein